MISFRASAKFDKEAAIVLIEQASEDSKIKFRFAKQPLNIQLDSLARTNQFLGKDGQIFPLVTDKQIILLTGIGKKKEMSSASLRIAVRGALMSPCLKEIKEVEIVPGTREDSDIKAIIEAIFIGAYSWRKYCTKEKSDKTIDVNDKKFFLVAGEKKIYKDIIAICNGTNLARNLVNDNADIVTSEYIEKNIREIIKGKKNISIETLNRKQLEAKGLGLLLAVNQGSNKEPKLIIVKYSGAVKKGNYTAIIGKGITYDTGGLNLKPTGHIETMKTDMSGAASVVGVLKNVIDLNLKKNIIFACALAENAIGPGAYKPGDVIRGYSGKTVEVANSDAEGRLVLADAISYIVKNYKPCRLIDIATLTGACIVALGNDYTALVSTDDELANLLLHSAGETDDRLWRLPMYSELKNSVKSQIADIRNVGSPKGAGGTITAAEFLRQFTDDTKWAHLDIAGTSFVEEKERMYFSHGATGSGVRLLTHFLQNN